jgi:hypothetical protein
MILVLEFGNERSWFGAIGARTARWLSSPAVAGDLSSLDKSLRRLGFSARRPPTGIVAVLADRSVGAPHVSWSLVRSAVAAVNAMAFAWGVTAAAVRYSGRESREELAAMARRAAASAKGSEWVSALYSGMPNISTPKKVL